MSQDHPQFQRDLMPPILDDREIAGERIVTMRGAAFDELVAQARAFARASTQGDGYVLCESHQLIKQEAQILEFERLAEERSRALRGYEDDLLNLRNRVTALTNRLEHAASDLQPLKAERDRLAADLALVNERCLKLHDRVAKARDHVVRQRDRARARKRENAFLQGEVE